MSANKGVGAVARRCVAAADAYIHALHKARTSRTGVDLQLLQVAAAEYEQARAALLEATVNETTYRKDNKPSV